ncbi:MAG: hypothetical protein FIA95_14540 [Gemmatimonadetes bacterium]|nr:hypothetical protein [Gemmatimonadota bacterium]
MRRAPSLAAVLAALATFAVSVPASAQSVTGTWELSWETPRGAQTTTFVFAQDGMNVTGTARMGRGEMIREVPIKNGMLHGDQLTFSLELGMGERTVTQTFAATVKGDAMEGKITTARGENPFKGVKKPS